MGKNHKVLYEMILTAIFSALCFVGVNIRIPLPIGFIHLGNFICILASLLCGGLVGGLSGSIGMGLFDLYYYGGFTAGVLRTVLLKLGMGLITGICFRIFLKKKIKPFIWNVSLLVVFTTFLILSSIACGLGGFDFLGNHIQINYTVPVFLALLVALYVGVLLMDRKLNPIAKTALTATSLGILFNIFGEIYIKALLYYLLESKYSTFEQAYVYSLSGLASVAVTSVLTCCLCSLVYYPIYRAVVPFMKFEEIQLHEEK